MAWPAVKEGFTQEQFRQYVAGLTWTGWRPSLIVWHNTAAPTIAQWNATADRDQAEGFKRGMTRINNLETFFHKQRGWSGAPHLFIAPDLIWVFNRLDRPGVHSPSWNSISWGFEMVGDFEREDPNSGDGFRVKTNCIFATAILCEAVGLHPSLGTIKLHREDPRTTHACPGSKIVSQKEDMVKSVAGLMEAGDHIEIEDEAPLPFERLGTVLVDDLNVRTGPGVANEAVTSLYRGQKITVLGEARNGSTVWLKIRTPLGYAPYWVAARYVQL